MGGREGPQMLDICIFDFSYFAVEGNVNKKIFCPSIGNFEEFIL